MFQNKATAVVRTGTERNPAGSIVPAGQSVELPPNTRIVLRHSGRICDLAVKSGQQGGRVAVTPEGYTFSGSVEAVPFEPWYKHPLFVGTLGLLAGWLYDQL